MTKFFFKHYVLAVCLFSAFSLISCSDHEEKGITKPDDPMETPDVPTDTPDDPTDTPDEPTNSADNPTESYGVFFLTQGQYSSGLEGSLNYVNFADNSIDNDIFQRVNGRSLGNTPQCGLVYGGKIYIGVYFSSTIEIIESKDYSSIKQIRLSESETGTQPRSMVARNGFVYISMYDGYVARLDTLSLSIDKRVKVGPNPEGIAIYNDKIYVANSDGMNYPIYGKTASVIDLASFTKITDFEVPLNPDSFVEADGKLYLLARGNFDDIDSAVYEINISSDESNYSAKLIKKATMMASDGKKLFLINSPWMKPMEYFVYDPKDESIKEWSAPEVSSPNQIGVDPFTGKIFITSYVMDGGFAGYSLPTYAAEYDSNLKFVRKYDLGVGVSDIFFNLR